MKNVTLKTDIGTVVSIEITDSLKQRNRDFGDNTPNTAYRLVMSFASDSSDMTDEQKALFAKLSEKQRIIMRANQTVLQYSGVFLAENILTKKDGSPFTTPSEGFNDEQQTAICEAIKKVWAEMNNQNIFTLATASISDLLKETKYDGNTSVDTEDGKTLTTQTRLFIGFFSDDERAFSMLQKSVLDRLEDGRLIISKKKAVPQSDVKDATAEQKSQISLDFDL